MLETQSNVYYFDNIKIILILVVIFIHAGIAYIPTAEGWSPTAFCFLISNYIVRKIPYVERVVFRPILVAIRTKV